MIDIGVNLTNSQFNGKVEQALSGAKQAGIDQIIITGTDIESSHQALGICRQYRSKQHPKLSCTVGVHPHDASKWSAEAAQQMEALLRHKEVVAVGETGLDFNRNFSTPEQQERAFAAQIEIACNTGKPLFLHERDAFERQIAILDSYKARLPKILIHCFTGNAEALSGYLQRGAYIGITGWVCDQRRGQELARIVKQLPLDRLMIETDAPYLLPRNIRPKPKSRTNLPEYLPWVVKKLADCYHLTETEIVDATSTTATDFFALD